MERDVSAENQNFWDELCGSHLAKFLGVTDNSRDSLARFDRWFMEYYSYLPRHIPFKAFQGRKVLEVGLGYGTVAQKIAAAGAEYTALDIANGPVQMVRHRLSQNDLSGDARVGSILDAPFEDDTFDYVVAIGCYHHTGNMQLALDETYRILKPGGQAIVMVYNALSYRRWIWSFAETSRYVRAVRHGDFRLFDPSDRERRRYDANRAGDAAPHTDFFSASHVRAMASRWSEVEIYTENVGGFPIFPKFFRRLGLLTVGKFAGLDIYCHFKK